MPYVKLAFRTAIKNSRRRSAHETLERFIGEVKPLLDRARAGLSVGCDDRHGHWLGVAQFSSRVRHA